MFGLVRKKKLREDELKQEIQSLKIKHAIELRELKDELDFVKQEDAKKMEAVSKEATEKLHRSGVFGG